MADTYSNFTALALAERKTGAFSITARDRGSSVVIAAPHGGAIEPGTSEIARAIAADDLSYYLFEGRKRAGNAALHITSSNFDEPECLKLLLSGVTVLTVHGEASKHEVVYLGGRDKTALERIRHSLADQSLTVCEHENPELQGTHPSNICNSARSGAGVQLELSLGLRRSFFASLNRSGRQNSTPRLAKFAAAIRGALLSNASSLSSQETALRSL
jgi:phage replication-related protein YjqB (UPF0714/DUF867 family)